MTFTNVVLSATPTAAVTSTVNAGSSSRAVTTNLLGVNLVYWDDSMSTSQTEQMAAAAKLQLYRFPGGSASDDFHFNQSTNLEDSALNTIPQFAQFISAVGGTGLVTHRTMARAARRKAEAELAPSRVKAERYDRDRQQQGGQATTSGRP